MYGIGSSRPAGKAPYAAWVLFVVLVALVGIGAGTGISTQQARTAAPATGPNSGNTNSEGTALSVARSDHVHSCTAAGSAQVGCVSTGAQTLAGAKTIAGGLVIDGSSVDYEAGTAEGFPHLAQSITPPATACDVAGEEGRLYWDTDGTSGQRLRGCEGVTGWVTIGGGGGGSLTVEEADLVPTVASVTKIQIDQADGFVLTDETGGQVQIDLAAVPDSVLASSYSGVGACAAGAAATTLSDNAAPTCSATVVFTNEGNTYSTGAQDFTTATSLTVPVALGAGPTANGTVAYDSTANSLEYGDATVNRTVANLDEAQTLSSKTLTTPTIGDFTNATHAHAAAASGGTVDIDSLAGVSSWATAVTKDTADLTLVGGIELDLEGGATEGHIRLPQSITPPATDCDVAAEAGRLYQDTDADTDGSVFFCRGATGWKDLDDDGGNGFGTIGAAVADAAADTITITDSASINLTTTDNPEDLTAAFVYADAGADPALAAEECVFSNEGVSAGGWVCEGATADLVETRFRVTDPTTSDRIISFPGDGDSNTVKPLTCTGTDKVSAISSSGLVTCTADAGAGAGAALTRIAGSSGAAGADITWQNLTADSANCATTALCAAIMTTTGVGAGTWRFTYTIIYQTAATATGIGFGINHTGTAPTFKARWLHVTTGGAAATGIGDDVTATVGGQMAEGKSGSTLNAVIGSASAGVATINANILATLEGILVVTATGSLEFKIASETTSAVRVMADSTLELLKIE